MKILSRIEWRPDGEAKDPPLDFLAPRERRRLTPLEKAAISVAWRALEPIRAAGEAMPRVVFASRWGEIGTTFKLMHQMYEEGEMSPAGFSNSVHNAAPGHLSLLTGNRSSYTAIAAGPKSYEMGLVEVASYNGKVLFVYAEEATPEFYRAYFPDVRESYAVAMLVVATGDGKMI